VLSDESAGLGGDIGTDEDFQITTEQPPAGKQSEKHIITKKPNKASEPSATSKSLPTPALQQSSEKNTQKNTALAPGKPVSEPQDTRAGIKLIEKKVQKSKACVVM